MLYRRRSACRHRRNQSGGAHLSELKKRLRFLAERRREALEETQSDAGGETGPEEKKPLDPADLPKFTEPLEIPDVYDPVLADDGSENGARYYAVDMSRFQQQILPAGFPKTTVFGYGGFVTDKKSGAVVYKHSTPGPTFEELRGRPAHVMWLNHLAGPHLFAVDPTLHWANPNNIPMDPSKPWPAFPTGFPLAQEPIPTVTHLHGGETPSVYDGFPDAWFTLRGDRGPAYRTNKYLYNNSQPPCTLWYHDHAMGITRLNVYAGLAGMYILRDPNNQTEFPSDGCPDRLPWGKYEIPLVLQDRSFYTDGSLSYPNAGLNPQIHPYWFPGFDGSCIMVNGKVWPYLEVERRRYRFRVLNGSNERFYHITPSNGMKMIQIGTDGGYLERPVEIASLMLAPAERADLILDFSRLSPGETVTLLNDASNPFPQGTAPDPETTGQILQLRVRQSEPLREEPLPIQLNTIPDLCPDIPRRIIALTEIEGETGPLEMLLNGLPWSAPVTEHQPPGSTQLWEIVNLMAGTHPIHLHLIQFQIVNRQPIDTAAYTAKWNELNGSLPLDHRPRTVPVRPYLTGPAISADKSERGWKDTARANPGEVLRLLVRIAPLEIPQGCASPGINEYPFDPSKGPGYVWHCHILEHEDNEMMRPFRIDRPMDG